MTLFLLLNTQKRSFEKCLFFLVHAMYQNIFFTKLSFLFELSLYLDLFSINTMIERVREEKRCPPAPTFSFLSPIDGTVPPILSDWL